MDFRIRIKDICKEKGIMMKELADRLDITPTGLSKAIGQDYPQLQTLERIAKALDVEVAELFSPIGKDEIICPKCGTKFKMIE
jgi:transcriptional regulator with XRE-family HTH domain